MRSRISVNLQDVSSRPRNMPKGRESSERTYISRTLSNPSIQSDRTNLHLRIVLTALARQLRSGVILKILEVNIIMSFMVCSLFQLVSGNEHVSRSNVGQLQSDQIATWNPGIAL